MAETQPHIMVVGMGELPITVSEALRVGLESDDPMITCVPPDRFSAVREHVTPDLTVITNFNLGTMSAAHLVQRYPEDRFVILCDISTRWQAEALGTVTVLQKPVLIADLASGVSAALSLRQG
jgi:hypothetical protein